MELCSGRSAPNIQDFFGVVPGELRFEGSFPKAKADCYLWTLFKNFIWLCRALAAVRGVSAVACGIFTVALEILVSTCMQDLVPQPGIEPGPFGTGSVESYPLSHQGNL